MTRVSSTAVAVLGLSLLAGPTRAIAPPVTLTGSWVMNRDLSSAPGGMPTPDGGGRQRGPGPAGGMGRGPGAGGPGGGAGRPGGGMRGPGGGGRGGPQGQRPSRDDLEARRALMDEILALPPHVTITQDGDKIVFIEPDGVVRTYVASGQAEKHQLTNGTIETRTTWDGPSLRIEIRGGDRATVIRTFSVRDDPRRLEITSTFDRAPKDARHLAVYDQAEPGR